MVSRGGGVRGGGGLGDQEKNRKTRVGGGGEGG